MISASLLSELILLTMLEVSPPDIMRTHFDSFEPDAQESVSERFGRYASISTALASVIVESETRTPINDTAIVLSITYHESSWNRDVDLGMNRGDSGRSWCLGQINIGSGSLFGITGPELVSDRRVCLSVSYRVAKMSIRACRKNKPQHRLAIYASGSCDKGHSASAVRLRTASAFVDRMLRIKRELTDVEDDDQKL